MFLPTIAEKRLRQQSADKPANSVRFGRKKFIIIWTEEVRILILNNFRTQAIVSSLKFSTALSVTVVGSRSIWWLQFWPAF